MNITVTCNSCGQKLSAPSALAGRRVPCPKCKAPLDVPVASGAQPGPALAVPQAAPEYRPHATQPPVAPVVADAGMIDLGLGAPLAPAPASYPAALHAGRSKGALVPIIAIVVLLFLVGGGVGAWLMLAGNGGLGSDLRYIPDNSDVVLSVDINGVISSSAGQKIKARVAEMLAPLNGQLTANSKLKIEDAGRMTMGGRAGVNQGAGVIHMNRVVTEQDLPDPAGAMKVMVGPYQMIVHGEIAYCLIDDRTVAVGQTPLLHEVLERNGPAKLSDDLKEAMNEVDFSKSLATALSMKNIIAAAGGAVPAGVDGIRGAALQADVGNDVRLNAVANFKDAATAEQMKKMADGMLAAAKLNVAQMPPEAAKLLNSLDVSNSGATVRAAMTIETDTVLSLIDTFGKGALLPPASQNSPERNPAPRPLAGRATPHSAPPPNSGPPSSPFNPGGNMKDAASRARASNNLKQIALALHGYHAAENHFPAPAICNAEGKPLLSWRVAILPQLGQSALYKQFHLNEPWDSPNNKRLVNRIPLVYRLPQGNASAGIDKTCLLAPIGEKAAFFGQQGRKIADFTDGLTNTILVVEAAPERAVTWTKPDDLTIDENDPTAGLFGQHEGGVLAAFGDGSVRLVPQAISKQVLAALFTINGGETVPADFGAK